MAHVTVRIPARLKRRLQADARKTGRTVSELIREALGAYLGDDARGESFYDRAKRLGAVGCVKNLPFDLSTNPEHMEDFGD